jgi:heme exporter protein A
MDTTDHGRDNRRFMAAPLSAPAPRPDTPVLLSGRRLTFLREDEPVFAPIDFDLRAGEVMLVEGDNGSGKTTLLRLLAGVLHRSEGDIRLHNEPLMAARMLGEIMFLGHNLGLKHDLSPLENLRFAAGLYGRRRGTSPETVLAGVGLEGYEDEPVRRLSAGQRKRAALARLLLIPASVWLLDEPYANLDREGIALVNRLLERHTREGGAALVTSHGAVTHLRGKARRIRLRP